MQAIKRHGRMPAPPAMIGGQLYMWKSNDAPWEVQI